MFGNVYVNIGYWMSHDPQPDKITSKPNLILLLILYRFGSGVIFHTQQPMLAYMLPIIMYYVLLIVYRFGLDVIGRIHRSSFSLYMYKRNCSKYKFLQHILKSPKSEPSQSFYSFSVIWSLSNWMVVMFWKYLVYGEYRVATNDKLYEIQPSFSYTVNGELNSFGAFV